MRQVVLDTETTGLETSKDHRILEIGCLELVNRQPTGRTLHLYINPEREIDEEALRVHGIDQNFLADKPVFSDIAAEFLNFVEGAELIIHNAPFDVGFLDHELKRMGLPDRIEQHCQVLDTLVLAKEMRPGARNSLDALCRFYGVDNSQRELHGALLDAQLLAEVYLLMTGGQRGFFDDESKSESSLGSDERKRPIAPRNGRIIMASASEAQLHDAYLGALAAKGTEVIWQSTSRTDN